MSYSNYSDLNDLQQTFKTVLDKAKNDPACNGFDSAKVTAEEAALTLALAEVEIRQGAEKEPYNVEVFVYIDPETKTVCHFERMYNQQNKEQPFADIVQIYALDADMVEASQVMHVRNQRFKDTRIASMGEASLENARMRYKGFFVK